MASKIEPTVLNGLNYAIWQTDMEMLLKSKGLWQYTKAVILDLSDASAKFIVDGKKDEPIRVITTYISREIWFHTSGIAYPHEVWKKLESLFDKVDESQVMHIEKQLISLDAHSFERIEDYLACVKELQLKLGESGKGFPMKDGQLIELALMNLRTLYDVFYSSFHTNWRSRKEDGNDYSFDVFCDLFIRDQQKLLDEGKLGLKQQAYLLKEKGKQNYKDRGRVDSFGPRQECLNQKTKLKIEES